MNLEDFVGPKSLTGKQGVIAKLIKANESSGFFPSLIFWGPPGSGKTTLARIIANELERKFYELSAVNTSSKEIDRIVVEAKQARQEAEQLNLNSKKKERLKTKNSPIVFIDEIHRFNKAQQDRLLPHVEKGTIVLIGATTENPSFEVISALLSRSRVVVLKQHTSKDLQIILNKALKEQKIKISKKARVFLFESSNGDARAMLNILEIASQITDKKTLSVKDIEDAMQKKQLSFDKSGEEHYNVISAFIKSMRASQTDAALYYLARMAEAGQDPLYIARRMVVFASEDIGMAQPTALVVANEVFRACETIGYPECAINLAHGVVYLSKAKKDRSAYDGLRAAQTDVKKYGNLPVPLKIRNAPTKLMKDLDYGSDYEMYSQESYLPDKIKNKKYYKK